MACSKNDLIAWLMTLPDETLIAITDHRLYSCEVLPDTVRQLTFNVGESPDLTDDELLTAPEHVMSATQLRQKYEVLQPGGCWAEHPDYPREAWAVDVSNDDTLAGYWEWVVGEIERNKDEDEEDEEGCSGS